MVTWITDAELLSLGLAADALGNVAADVRAAHCLAASAHVWSRLAPRFEIDPDTWEPGEDVKRAVGAIAVESILGRRGYDPRGGGQADPVGAAAREARTWLADVLAGRARPLNVDALTERGGPLVAGTDESSWAAWRSGGLT